MCANCKRSVSNLKRQAQNHFSLAATSIFREGPRPICSWKVLSNAPLCVAESEARCWIVAGEEWDCAGGGSGDDDDSSGAMETGWKHAINSGGSNSTEFVSRVVFGRHSADAAWDDGVGRVLRSWMFGLSAGRVALMGIF